MAPSAFPFSRLSSGREHQLQRVDQCEQEATLHHEKEREKSARETRSGSTVADGQSVGGDMSAFIGAISSTACALMLMLAGCRF